VKRLALLFVATIAAGPAAQAPQSPPGPKPRAADALEIYVADTEGGKAALFVSPSGQTVLVDSGNPGPRDGERILAMLNDAGVKQIDYLISTHYHVDHVGGLAELARRIPIAHYIDHGPNSEAKPQVQGFDAAYEELRAKARHTAVKPGDRVPVTGLDWRIVTSAGQVLKAPLPGGGRPNPACAQFQKKPDPPAPDDNAASVGSVITFGQFRVVDLGDLLWNVEGELMCPNNPIGTVDLYMVTHHGLANSGAPPLVHGVRPRVALMQNGTRKGGAVATYEILRQSSGLEDIWQLHWSHNAGIEHNPPGVFIANVDDPEVIATVLTSPAGRGRGGPGGPGAGPGPGPGPGGGPGAVPGPGVGPNPGPGPGVGPNPGPGPGAGPGAQAGPPAGAPGRGGPGGFGRGNAAHTPAYYLRVTARQDGSFTVTNTRNGFTKSYPRRGQPAN
jgi:beta-lactamase superfamily II metal-dependent hydrolase